MNIYAEKMCKSVKALTGFGWIAVQEHCEKAAAEIERLEAALKELSKLVDDQAKKIRRLESAQAAAEIERLEAENKRLREAIISNACALTDYHDPMCVLARELKATKKGAKR